MVRIGCRAALLTAALSAWSFGVAGAQLAGDPSPTDPKNVYDEATRTAAEDENFAPKDAKDDQLARAERIGVPSRWPQLYDGPRLNVTGFLNGGIAPFVMWNNAFAAPAGSVNAGLPVNPGWAEAYVEPGVTAGYRLGSDAYAYGGLAYMESGTVGTDFTGSVPAWYGLPEQLYAGVHVSRLFGGNATLDASYGQQDYDNGNGMLLALGATNGFNRGAAYAWPRTAWRQAGLLRATDGNWSAQLFYLRPNEAPADFDDTALSGVNLVWNPPGRLRLGVQYVYSSSDVVTRNQTSTYEFRARLHPLRTVPNFWLQADYAVQGKPLLAADGWMVQAEYNCKKMWWQPLFNAGYFSFSGAKPSDTVWREFDPLYFGGSVPAWFAGFALENQLVNTNLRYFDASVTLSPQRHGSLQLNYVSAGVDQLHSILTTLPPSVPPSARGGLPAFGYGSEVAASYTDNLGPALSVNPFYAFAWPGSGIVEEYRAHEGTARNWSFLGIVLTATY